MAGKRNRRNLRNAKKWRKKKRDHIIRVFLAALLVISVFAIATIAVSFLFGRDDATNNTVQPGRVIFVGDSRTIDMFADSDEPLDGVMRDGVLVYARHGHAFDYFKTVMDLLQPGEGDTVISFMGANDDGVFEPYGALYGVLLAQGVELVVCTIGPCATGEDYANQLYPAYHNTRMTAFNELLVPWADENNVPVIDTYTYISDHIELDPDGIHYLPRPTHALWQYILNSLDGMEVLDEAASRGTRRKAPHGIRIRETLPAPWCMLL